MTAIVRTLGSAASNADPVSATFEMPKSRP